MLMNEFAAITFLQAHLATPFAMAFFIFSARWLIFIVATSCIIGFVVEREPNHRHAWKELFWSVGIACVVSLVLSALVGRTRPFSAFPELVRAWVPAPATAFSFPSTHAALSWAWAFSATKLSPAGAPIWFLTALLISLSRIIVGVHFPSDVIMGALIGGAGFAYVQWGHKYLRRTPLV